MKTNSQICCRGGVMHNLYIVNLIFVNMLFKIFYLSYRKYPRIPRTFFTIMGLWDAEKEKKTEENRLIND